MNPVNHSNPATIPEDQIPVAAGYFRPVNAPRPSARSDGSLWDSVTKLPRWARVAIAARCARRVYPLFSGTIIFSSEGDASLLVPDKVFWPILEPKVAADAILTAEGYAGTAEVDSILADVPLFAAQKVPRDSIFYHAAMAAHIAAHGRGTPEGVTAHARGAVEEAARLLTNEVPSWDRSSPQPRLVIQPDEVARSISAQVKDLRLLLHKAREESWTDDTPVPPEVFGPMWPDGPPMWWGRLEDNQKRIEGHTAAVPSD